MFYQYAVLWCSTEKLTRADKMFECADIKKLAELFNPQINNSDSEEEIEDASKQTAKASVQSKPEKAKKVNPYAKIEPDKSKREEIVELADPESYFEEEAQKSQSDWKKTPSWDIAYKQQITASDVFLQMGLKTPSSASCEDMIVTINLPGEKRQNVDLKIKQNNLILISPRFYLDLPLPHPVDPQKGNAQFDSEADKLIVTLRMDRELDLVNF